MATAQEGESSELPLKGSGNLNTPAESSALTEVSDNPDRHDTHQALLKASAGSLESNPVALTNADDFLKSRGPLGKLEPLSLPGIANDKTALPDKRLTEKADTSVVSEKPTGGESKPAAFTEHDEEIEDLRLVAAGDSPDADVARGVLFRIATSKNDKVMPGGKPGDVQVRAAQALTSLLKTGDPTNTKLSEMVLDMLACSDNERVRLESLNGLHKLTAYNKEQGPPVVLSQIMAELRRQPEDQSSAVQSGLANCAVFYPGPIMRSLLNPLAEKSSHPEIRDSAKSMIDLSNMANARKRA